MTGCRQWLWGVLGWLSLGAQTPSSKSPKDTLPPIDSAITPFEVHQQTILRLIAYHQPDLDTIEARLRAWRDTLNQMIEIARYPKRLPFYVDSFRVITGRIRAGSESALAQLKNMCFEWLPHQYALMAVYTRFGELKVVHRLTPSVRETLAAYRRYLDRMNQLAQTIADIWTDCDYLLLSKLK
ncbi:MAG: hypothetical protein N3E49_08590 [Bacteroidia bacterium]|nr:hypothetical protein [Bacteroidia bacterium]